MYEAKTMINRNYKPAILLLEDGTYFEGQSCGIQGITGGEICFNTGMTGYQEIFTDPSYFGQIMVMASVHIGNYGARSDESESQKVYINGLVCKNFSTFMSRSLAQDSLQHFLELHQVVGISGIDTRALIRHIRTHGAMNAIISSTEMDISKLKQQVAGVPDMSGLELASKVSFADPFVFSNPNAKYRLAVMDFGIKKSILEQLSPMNMEIKVYPAKTSMEDLKNYNAHAYFLSNGPGDPSAMDYAIETVAKIVEEKKPTFGICLGHQLFSLSQGVNTFKMHHGHHGINHPVKNLLSGLGEITSQNHGFAVDPIQLEKSSTLEVSHINLNDQSIEGVRHKTAPIFSVQYHPEAGPGPHDSRYLFNQFKENIESFYQIQL